MAKARKRSSNGSGTVRQLASGRWQARVSVDGRQVSAPSTFDTKLDATAWLKAAARRIDAGTFGTPEKHAATHRTFGVYAQTWLDARDLRPRTRDEYQRLLDNVLIPAFGDDRLSAITPAQVRAWHGSMSSATPTRRAHAYALLRTIMGTAAADDLIEANPCRIRGAGSSKRTTKTRVATLDELEALTAAMPERYRPMVQLAAWCGLRFGELAELRRGDIDLDGGVVRVRRAVVRLKGEKLVGDPKSDAGIRDVTIPPHVIPLLREHLEKRVGPEPGALLFPARGGGNMAPSTLYRVFYPARDKIGRPDLRWHDLRHTGATLAAATGATLADLMARLGHSTPQAAMKYQHAAADRDRAIADALSGFVGAKVTPLREVKR